MAHVYAIEADNGCVKVGYSNDVEKRLEQLQRASPVVLTLVGKVEADNCHAVENAVHDRLEDDHLHAEWFDTDENVLEIIEYFANLDEDELPRSRETRKNVKVPEPLFWDLREDKPDELSWPDYLENECLGNGSIFGGVPDDLREQLERIEAGVEAIEDRTGTIEDHLGARYG